MKNDGVRDKYISDHLRTNAGKKRIKPRIDNPIPEILPIAKVNQKTSLGPSKRKGTRPRMVERMVKEMGTILRSKALM